MFSCEKLPNIYIEPIALSSLHKFYAYAKLYPTGSSPGKFHGTAKVHKLAINDAVEQLPLRPIVSNLNTATYPLARYLAKILSPLSRSQYTVKSSNKFVNVIKQHVIPSSYRQYPLM